MRRLDRSLIAAAIIATTPILLAAGAGVAAETAGTLYAANRALPQPAALETAQPAAVSATVLPVRELEAAPTASGAEPDPESFDRAGLEIWWAKYRKAHPKP
ncbi:MAG: hypothetical protein ACLQJR_04070 [Stellaceae bacterium]